MVCGDPPASGASLGFLGRSAVLPHATDNTEKTIRARFMAKASQSGTRVRMNGIHGPMCTVWDSENPMLPLMDLGVAKPPEETASSTDLKAENRRTRNW